MIHRARILTMAACLVLGGGPELWAGGIHVLYPADAFEKLAGANEVYTEGMMHLYHRHPRWFEHEHPFFTEMFNNPEMMDRLVARWEGHERRFEYWHNSLWRVLDAYAIRHDDPLPQIPIVRLSASNAVSEAQGNGPGGGGGARGSGSGGNISGASVPEPSTGILVVSGLVAGLVGFAWRRVSRRPPSGPCVPA
jgi:hypothetical protein